MRSASGALFSVLYALLAQFLLKLGGLRSRGGGGSMRRMSEENKTFEVLDAVSEQKAAIPALKKSVDGFTRRDVVDALQNAFVMIGGVQRLALWANANPDKFYPLYARMLPSTTINIGEGSNVQIVHSLAPTELDRHPTGPVETGGAPGDGSPLADG